MVDNTAGGNLKAYSTDEEVDIYEAKATKGLSARERKVVDRDLDPGGSLLDLGCGVGRTTVALDAQGFDAVGVDMSGESIRRARRHFPDLEFEIANAVALPFADESFEYVLFFTQGLDYAYPESQRYRALEEIHRVLEPGGVFAFSSHNPWYRFPAALLDREYLFAFFLNRPNLKRSFDQYKLHVEEHAQFETYFANPVRQVRQLRRHGFESVEFVGERNGPLRYFERAPHYVARKPATPHGEG